MAVTNAHPEPDDEEIVPEEEFIDPNDVLVEDADDDVPMDDDEDDDENADNEHTGEDEEMVLEDTSVQQFATHRKPVYAVAVHPTLPIAASGGEDELGYLWNLEDGEQILRLSGHSDSVTNTAFSSDGSMIATGGMDGKTRIWRKLASDTTGKLWEFLTEITGPDEVMVSAFPISFHSAIAIPKFYN